MVAPEQRQKKQQEAEELLAELSELDAPELARTEDLSRDINFSGAVPHLTMMLDVVRQMNDRDLSRLPVQQFEEIIKGCTKIQTLVGQIVDFDLNTNSPGDTCTSITTQIGASYDEIMNVFLLPLAFTATQATDYAKIEREAKGYHTTMEEEYKEFSEYIEGVKIETEKALSAVQEQAAEAGVSSNAQIFQANAKVHERAATKWLKATIALTAVTFFAAVGFLWAAIEYTPGSVTATIQYVVSKLIVLSALSFGVFLCAKNFKAHKHNQTVSQHRADALKTFRAFVEGTSDAGMKDAILLHAAQAAFAPRSTGYEEAEGEIQNVNPVVEVLGSALSRSQ